MTIIITKHCAVSHSADISLRNVCLFSHECYGIGGPPGACDRVTVAAAGPLVNWRPVPAADTAAVCDRDCGDGRATRQLATCTRR